MHLSSRTFEHDYIPIMNATNPLNNKHGYWGPPTAMIDWCETNYEYSIYIAEFWNTISNIFFVLFGLYGLSKTMKAGFERRFHLQFIAVIITGIGSAMFHGTLQIVHQQCDETPMIWTVLIGIYISYNDEFQKAEIPDKLVIFILTSLGVGFGILHAIYRFTTGFQVVFAILASLCCVRLCVHYVQVKDPRARAVARSYVRNSLVAFAFWLTDYHLCGQMKSLPINPQAHAWWHFFMGIASYHGPIFMQYVRLEQQQKHPEIISSYFGLESIVIHGEGKMMKKAL